uniref:Serine/threonine-protein kinase n=1 Tax=Acidobacterium capsulatum TaxID=33075 RepID=A0A7V5CST8_9BACT
MREAFHSFSAGEIVAENYRVLDVAGVGGMGTVLRAFDERLERIVALKFLPEDPGIGSSDKERLLREARTASTLDHPNLGSVYGMEQTPDGRTFLVMPFYDGGTLPEWIRHHHPSLNEKLRLAMQIARGLDEAHAQGIVHRDIKPSNIMMTAEGMPKIVDFGLAYILSGETVSRTETTGTVAYMAPEQAKGRPVDGRCDIWALGVVMAEMLTGSHPFHRETLAGILYAILHDAPQHLEVLPPDLQTILFRMLSKDPASRYGSCSVLLQDLETLLAQMPDPGQPSLPPSARGQAQLRRVRDSASRPALEDLASSRPRIVWWAAAAGGVLIAAGVVAGLVPSVRQALLLHAHHLSVVSHDSAMTAKPAAYQDYLTALGYVQRYDQPGNLEKAIHVLRQAVQVDPGFALGYAELAEACRLQYQTTGNISWLNQAAQQAGRSRQLDSTLPAAWAVLGEVHDLTNKPDLALAEFQQALKLDPHNPAAIRGLAHAYETEGRVADAEAAYTRAANIAPQNWDGFDSLGAFYDRHGKYQQAIAAFQRALALTPDNAQVLLNIGAVYLDTGNSRLLPLAEDSLRHSLALHPSYAAYVNLGVAYAEQSRFRESIDVTSKALAINSNDYMVWLSLLSDYESLGMARQAADVRAHMVPLMEQQIKIRPQNATTHALLADVYAGQQKRQLALAQLQIALTISPDDPQSLANGADVYANLDEPRQSIRYIQRALSKGLPVEQLLSDPELRVELHDPAVKALLRKKGGS